LHRCQGNFGILAGDTSSATQAGDLVFQAFQALDLGTGDELADVVDGEQDDDDLVVNVADAGDAGVNGGRVTATESDKEKLLQGDAASEGSAENWRSGEDEREAAGEGKDAVDDGAGGAGGGAEIDRKGKIHREPPGDDEKARAQPRQCGFRLR